MAAIIAGFILVALAWAVMAVQRRGLEDPENTEIIYLDQVLTAAQMRGAGDYLVEVVRQSGNPHQEPKQFASAEAAVEAALSTLRRAGIEYVLVRRNSPDHLELSRPFHDHRGRKEGRKVGWVEITRIG